MSAQNTLLTSSKGVDLPAATAFLVMKERLEGGDRLQGLRRCELHTFWGEPTGINSERLLDTARYYNPNKHHFGLFNRLKAETPWFQPESGRGKKLPLAWPGQVLGTDLPQAEVAAGDLYDRLLGGQPGDNLQIVDVAAFDLGQEGPVVSGVLWRLILACEPGEAEELGDLLTVARGRKQGLLVNPHMTDWLLRVEDQGREPR